MFLMCLAQDAYLACIYFDLMIFLVFMTLDFTIFLRESQMSREQPKGWVPL